jgi:hypothetical protein
MVVVDGAGSLGQRKMGIGVAKASAKRGFGTFALNGPENARFE